MLKITDKPKAYIVMGAGGTGSWLASFLSKSDVETILIDGDLIEDKNIIRQNFFQEDVNMFKAEKVAERYGHSYVNEFMTDTSLLEELIEDLDDKMPVLVGCLDNNASRKLAHDVFMSDKYSDIIWVDAGNAERHGQLYVAVKENGEVKYDSPINIDEAFQNFEGDERRPDQISCAEHSESAPQNVTANVTSATMIFNILNIIEQSGLLLSNKFSFDTKTMTFTQEEIK